MKKRFICKTAFLAGMMMIFVGLSSCVNINSNNNNNSTDYSGTIYADFYNYPTGKQNLSGTLTVQNQLTTSQVLIFDGTVEAANYIGTIPAGSSINVKLDAGKFHTIVGIMKSDYDDNKDLTLCGQSSVLTYYSSTQGYKVSVSPSNLAGAGTWIFNNSTSYWASIENVDNSGTTYAVIQPNAKQVKVPIELNKSISYKIVYKKELKYNDVVVAINDSSTVSDNDDFMLDETQTTMTTYLTGTTTLADDLAPSVLFVNNSGKGLRVYNGSVQLANINSTADDYVVNSGRTAMLVGFTAGTNLSALNVYNSSYTKNYYCTDTSNTLTKGKVYVVTVSTDSTYGTTGSTSTSPITWSVTEKEASEYYDE